MTFLYTIFAILGGISFAIQGPVNAGLGVKTNKFQAALISFSGGLIILSLFTFVLGHSDLNNIKGIEAWKLLGGVYGAFNVCISIACMPKIGVTLAITVNMIGQLVAAAVIDSLNVFETSIIPVTPLRIIGILVSFIGIILIYRGNSQNDKATNSNTESKLLPTILMFISGITGAMQAPTNRALANVIGNVEGTLINFVVGFTCMLIINLIVNKGKFISLKSNEVKPWQCLGGLFGLIGVFTNIFVVGVIGSTLQTISQLAGQLFGALIIDSTGALETKKIKINSFRVFGILLIIGGAFIVLLSKLNF